MANHGIAGPLVAGAQRQIAVLDGGRNDVILDQVALEFVAGMRTAAVAEMVGRITLGEQLQDAAAILDGCMRSRCDDQAVTDLGGAGGNQFRLAFD